MKYTVAVIKDYKIEVKQTFTKKENAEYYKAGIILGLMINKDNTRTIEIYEIDE